MPLRSAHRTLGNLSFQVNLYTCFLEKTNLWAEKRSVLLQVRDGLFSGAQLLSLCPGKPQLFLLHDVAEQLNNQWKTDWFSLKSACILFKRGVTYYMTSFFFLQLM